MKRIAFALMALGVMSAHAWTCEGCGAEIDDDYNFCDRTPCGAAKPRKAGEIRTITLPGGATMELVWCPATTSDEWKSISGGKDYFLMGSPTNEVDGLGPDMQHRVTLTKGFWLGKYEVTQRQWQSVMGSNPSRFKGDDRPVENVSWNDCTNFIQKVNSRLDCGARLPTEAEWEYACRAGTTTAYFWGNALNGDKANCNGNYPYPYRTTAKGQNLERTTDVGSYSPNAWGLYDMHGNVWEWCNDWCQGYYCYCGDATDPTGPASGNGRVSRGGSWILSAKNSRSARRGISTPDDSGDDGDSGFRLCCSAGSRNGEDVSQEEREKNTNQAGRVSPKTRSSIRDAGHEGVLLWEGSPYWATTNIGAEKPEDSGLYFWWGDTEGYRPSPDGKFSFNFFTNNAAIYTFGKSESKLQSSGWLTGERVLVPSHDAAHVKWGGNWRMPKIQELMDLRNKCDCTWTTRNGVKGYVVRGRGTYASNSIFLPCARVGYETSLDADSDLDEEGEGSSMTGACWSSVPYVYGSCAYGLLFVCECRSISPVAQPLFCCAGLPVRPVQGLTK